MEKQIGNFTVLINNHTMWKYEASEAALKEKGLLNFIENIDDYPIEKLISGQAYHNKSKKLISITVKPIKTTFIIPYYRNSIEGTLIFPNLNKKRGEKLEQ